MIGAVFTAQLFSTFAMTGLIWFVQLVHYPLFALVAHPHHAAYAAQHQTRTGRVVAPLMLAELATSFAMLWPRFRPAFISLEIAATGFGLVVLIWVSTAVLQVPLHSKLLAGTSESAIRKLVLTNWIRTLAWSVRSGLLLGGLLSIQFR